MLKKLKRFIRRQLFSFEYVRARVELHRLSEKKRQHHERWAEIMHAGGNVRPDWSARGDTLEVVTLEEYRGGRVVAREEVILESTNWGSPNI